MMIRLLLGTFKHTLTSHVIDRGQSLCRSAGSSKESRDGVYKPVSDHPRGVYERVQISIFCRKNSYSYLCVHSPCCWVGHRCLGWLVHMGLCYGWIDDPRQCRIPNCCNPHPLKSCPPCSGRFGLTCVIVGMPIVSMSVSSMNSPCLHIGG